MTNNAPESLGWPISQLGEAMHAVARHCNLSASGRRSDQEISGPPTTVHQPIASVALNEWVETTADFLGFEAQPIEASYAEVETLVRGAGPALLRLPENRVLAVIKSNSRRATILGPDLQLHRAPVTGICSVLRRPHAAKAEGEVDRLLLQAGIPVRRRARARAAILREQLGRSRACEGWLLRSPASANFWRQLRESGVIGSLAATFGLRLIHYALLLTAWWVLGQGALNGQLHRGQFGHSGLLIAWAMLLVMAVPFHLLAEWVQGRFAIEASARLKGRLLLGALRLQPEEVRHRGAGQMLGKIYESHAIESLSLSGGFVAVPAVIELTSAALILSGGGGRLSVQLVMLISCVALTIFFAWKYYRRRLGWTETRTAMTNDLVERLSGHRTRLAQEALERWHEAEDSMIENYLIESHGMDRASAFQMILPRAWLAAGLCGLAATFVNSKGDTLTIALGIGGLLLGYRGLQKLNMSLSSLQGAAIAWKQIADIFKAAGRQPDGGSPDFVSNSAKPGGPEHDITTLSARPETLIEAHDLTFRHQERGEPVLQACHLRIRMRDRLLLEGESGCGKSTLVSLLAGLCAPESGLLLLNGLDRHTMGAAGWSKRVALAPQFHENHVLTGTFAFNLLMGRGWPPSDKDMEEAEQICRELGLSDLLSRMPAGLLQMVGECGWQLSHGERSRMFMARALLQGADLVILDESFGALDPATLQQCLQAALKHARTLLIIAHL